LFLGVPYNVLVFNALFKYVASKLGVPVGKQLHFSDSLHLYENNLQHFKDIIESKFVRAVYDEAQTGLLFSELIDYSVAISDFKFDILPNSSALKKIFSVYFSFKENKDVDLACFKGNEDIFTVSSKAWLSKRKVCHNV
jgi:hypothetical protein